MVTAVQQNTWMDEDRFKRYVSRRGGKKQASINLLQHMVSGRLSLKTPFGVGENKMGSG